MTVAVPHIAQPTGQDDSTTKEATVTLPAGMGINPSAAAEPNNLATCDDGNFPLHSTLPITCPVQLADRDRGDRLGGAARRLELEGPVFIARQLSTDPASGNEYRIFLDAHSDRYGVDVRLVGHVFADPTTGRLTTRITEIPQVPFTSFRLNFNGGEQSGAEQPDDLRAQHQRRRDDAVVGQPGGDADVQFRPPRHPGRGRLRHDPRRTPLRPLLRRRLRRANKAGAYSPLHITLGRGNGQQELKAATVALAPGMIGKLAGIPYCSAGALAAAAGTSGAEQASALELPRRRAKSVSPRSRPGPARRRSRSPARSSSQAPTTGLLSPWQ